MSAVSLTIAGLASSKPALATSHVAALTISYGLIVIVTVTASAGIMNL